MIFAFTTKRLNIVSKRQLNATGKRFNFCLSYVPTKNAERKTSPRRKFADVPPHYTFRQ